MKNSQYQSLRAGHLTIKIQTWLQIPVTETVLNLNSKLSRKAMFCFGALSCIQQILTVPRQAQSKGLGI